MFGKTLCFGFLVRVDETNVELRFTDVDAKCRNVHERCSLLDDVLFAAPRSTLLIQAHLTKERHQILCDLLVVRAKWRHRELDLSG